MKPEWVKTEMGQEAVLGPGLTGLVWCDDGLWSWQLFRADNEQAVLHGFTKRKGRFGEAIVKRTVRNAALGAAA